MSELDKFKRRTIRSVARLLLREKKPPEELWAEMKKETGTDCRVLWERMRALCIKKLNRMIAADDRSANLPTIARLSLTDWLLVDLVLVHEEVDVIAMDKDENKDFPALIELFNLVQRFDVEARCGEQLAEAWAAATVFYNRQGRQCSPMLLQRRWYQLKKLTRCRFYKFWFSYRGNTRLLEEARKCMPTRLQMAIAKRYPKMITAEFPDWEDLIKDGRVIMPEEFEAKMRMPNLPKPCNSNAPDLVLVEPVIETIDLRIESDHEALDEDEIEDTSDPEKSNDATDITCPTSDFTSEDIAKNETLIAPVKTEPIEEDGLSNVQLISATHVPEVEVPDESPDGSPKLVSPSQSDGAVLEESQIDNNSDEDDLIEIPTIIPTVSVDLEKSTGNVVQTVTAEISPNDVPCDVDTINDSDEGVEDIIKLKADEYCCKTTKETPSENYNTIGDLIEDKVKTFFKNPKVDSSFNEKKPDANNINIVNKEDISAIDLMADLNFVDDGIEFVDDGVEFVEEDAAHKTESAVNSSPGDQIEETSEENNKFDLKLLMYPVVYTTKLDQMKIFADKSYESVETNSDIEMALVESKPVSKQSLSMKIKEESVTAMNEDTAENDYLLPNTEVTDDEEIEEDEKVSPSSYLLKKPRTRTYDLIKLCKNPDFNTKLKRLTIGFLSSTRNRQLLNACIPMTIDLSKAFESKLVNKTLYLKSSGTTPNIVNQELIDDKQASSIVPTAMSVQSLIDNSKVDIHNLISPVHPLATEPIVSERTKVINLPDIDKIRKINQKLLTAQVPPIRVTAGNVPNERAPSTLGASNTAQVVEKSTLEVNPAVSINVPTVSNMQSIDSVTSSLNALPTKVKVENEKSVHSNDISDTTDIITPPETLPPAKEKLVKMINLAKISTQEALAKIDDGAKQNDFPMPIQVKEVKANLPYDVPVAKKSYSYQPRVPLAWAPKVAQPIKNLDNLGLLTSDTLNKMLHLLMSGNAAGSGCNCCNTKTKTKKIKRKWRQEAKQQEIENKTIENEENKLAPIEKEDALPKSSSPPPLIAQDAPKDTVQETKKNTKLVVLGRVVKYCCWAKQKICNRKRMTRHECLPNACQCCCADELVAKIMKDEENKKKELENRANKDIPIELSDDDEESLRKACESIETVVQQARDNTTTSFGQVETSAAHTMVINPIVSTSVTTSGSSPSKVTVAVGVIPSEFQNDVSITPAEHPFIQTVRAAPVASLMPKRPPAPRIQVNPKPRRVQPSQWAPCTCQKPAVSQDSQCYIVIDASVMNCPRHPKPITPTPSVAATRPIAPTPSVAATRPIAPITHVVPTTPFVPTAPIVPSVSIISKTPKTPAQKQEKVLYLHSKSLAKSPSESPIFLGKNKILLTTVKFPRNTEDVAPAAEVAQAPKIIPTLPLPAGVQLVLMPSGDVTYTLDPGVELDDAQLAALPTILAAVMEQLNSSGISSATMAQTQTNTTGAIAPVAVAQPENACLAPSGEASEMPQSEGNVCAQTKVPSPVTLQTNEVIQDPEPTQKNTNVVDMEVDSDNVNADASTQQGMVTIDPDNIPTPLSEQAANEVIDPVAPKDTEPVSTPTAVTGGSQVNETQSVIERAEKSNVNEGINNRKSLLSDLMEMSGISAEDAVAPEQTVSVPPPLTNLQNTANVTVSDDLRNLPELSPVTSFAELKYACEQNGKFFKLDFETGVIVPINVCIKKNPKNKPLNIRTKECIDLTDDADSSDVVITKKQEAPAKPQFKGPVEYSFNGKTVSVTDPVKPVKLFKAFRPKPTVLHVRRPTKVQVTETLFNNKQTHIEKRKARVEARIDLVDSDVEPMEEEYLLESSDDDSRAAVDPVQIEALDPFTQSDDSSDDEPLAKKSKRLKEGEPANQKCVREINIYDELPEPAVINNDLAAPDSNEIPLGVREDFSEVSAPDNIGLNFTVPEDRSSADDVVPSASGTNKAPLKEKNSLNSVVVTSGGPLPVIVREGILDAPVDEEASEDEGPDKASKKFMEIRFMADPSDGEEAEDILGV